MNFQCTKVLKDPVGHYVLVKGRINDEPVTFASVYVPKSGQVYYFQEVLVKIHTFQEGPLVLGTDLNYVVNKYLDIKRPHGKRKLSKGPSAISQLLAKHDLVDIWWLFNAADRSYTYFSSRFDTFTRID